ELHVARVGFERTEHQAQQGGLAGAVGADQADSVAALDQRREAPHHPALAGGRVEALADVDQLGNPPPGAAPRIEPDAQLALLLATLLALAAQCLEPAQPPLVAGPARLDALADPGLFLLPEAIEATPAF